MNAASGDPPARRGTIRFTRANGPRLEPGQARRQGEITRLALLLLGREAAIAFLNTANPELGGRPLDLATASDDGRNRVEAAIGRIAYAAPGADRRAHPREDAAWLDGEAGGGSRGASRDPAGEHFRRLGEPVAAPDAPAIPVARTADAAPLPVDREDPR